MAATAFLEHQSKQNNRRKLLRSLMFACEKSLGNLRATTNQKSSARSVGKNERSSPIAPTKSYQNYTRLDDAFKESSDLLILLTYIISTEYLFFFEVFRAEAQHKFHSDKCSALHHSCYDAEKRV